MLRPPFAGHRRYSITHRAVQRLRELVAGQTDLGDETLRDHLDAALCTAEDAGRAVRTLDAMLGEPQTLIPVETLGETLYAIIKEDTVVTVLPKGHGEEILQRGQAMEQRVASGQVRPGDRKRPEVERRPGTPRRRWQTEGRLGEVPRPPVVERIGRGTAEPIPAARPARGDADVVQIVPDAAEPIPEGPVATALHAALERGRRRAAVLAIQEVLERGDQDAALLPLWNALARHRLAQSMTLGDLTEAVTAAGQR